MRSGHHQFFDIIILQGLHAFDTLAAPVLAAEIIDGHSLDITKFRHGYNRVFPGDHILHGNIVGVKTDSGSSVVPVFLGNGEDLFPDHSEKEIPVRKDCF